jgi:hypothetical protein
MKIKSAPNRDAFSLRSEWAVRPDDLQEALLEHRPHILHLSTHANRAEGIFLEDDLGEKKPVSPQALANLISKLERRIHIVFLNACYTKRQIKPLSEAVDYIIAMNTSIGDKGAIVFAASFYRGLAFGLSVKAAFDLAISQLELESIPDTKTPTLLVRDGVDMSAPFLSTQWRSAPAPVQRAEHPVLSNDVSTRGTALEVETRTKPTTRFKSVKRSDTNQAAEIRRLIRELRSRINHLEAILVEEESPAQK